MTVPEATNRLLHEIKKTLPYWEKQLSELDIRNKEDQEAVIYNGITQHDAEVEEALKNLIKAIQEEG